MSKQRVLSGERLLDILEGQDLVALERAMIDFLSDEALRIVETNRGQRTSSAIQAFLGCLLRADRGNDWLEYAFLNLVGQTYERYPLCWVNETTKQLILCDDSKGAIWRLVVVVLNLPNAWAQLQGGSTSERDYSQLMDWRPFTDYQTGYTTKLEVAYEDYREAQISKWATEQHPQFELSTLPAAGQERVKERTFEEVKQMYIQGTLTKDSQWSTRFGFKSESSTFPYTTKNVMSVAKRHANSMAVNTFLDWVSNPDGFNREFGAFLSDQLNQPLPGHQRAVKELLAKEWYRLDHQASLVMVCQQDKEIRLKRELVKQCQAIAPQVNSVLVIRVDGTEVRCFPDYNQTRQGLEAIRGSHFVPAEEIASIRFKKKEWFNRQNVLDSLNLPSA